MALSSSAFAFNKRLPGTSRARLDVFGIDCAPTMLYQHPRRIGDIMVFARRAISGTD
jgi:hypothetical protein